MSETWYSSIPRLVAILIAIALYGITLFSIFRRPKGIKLSSSENTDRTPFGYSGPERRIYPRAKLGIGIRYKLYSKEGGLYLFKEGKARDISEGGILLETNEKLGIDDKLELKLKLPKTSQFILIRGSIVWAKELEGGKGYRYGISFTEIDPNDKKMIVKHVAEAQSLTESGG